MSDVKPVISFSRNSEASEESSKEMNHFRYEFQVDIHLVRER